MLRGERGYGAGMTRSKSDIESRRARMREILKILARAYPEAECSLKFRDPFELLVAVILSAQCTDERVNQVTPALFERFPGPREMASAPAGEIEQLIKSTNFFRNKAIAIQATAKALLDRHDGHVPRDLESLVELRGVGRKTANVVLGVAYGIPGLVVDTHVGRISRRMGFTRETDPVKVEQVMMEIVERKHWTEYAHWLIHHGRAVCTARKALCGECPIARLCPKVGV